MSSYGGKGGLKFSTYISLKPLLSLKRTPMSSKNIKVKVRKKRKPLNLNSLLTFGKYRGKRVNQVFQDNPEYFEWLETNMKNFWNRFDKDVHQKIFEVSRHEQYTQANINFTYPTPKKT